MLSDNNNACSPFIRYFKRVCFRPRGIKPSQQGRREQSSDISAFKFYVHVFDCCCKRRGPIKLRPRCSQSGTPELRRNRKLGELGRRHISRLDTAGARFLTSHVQTLICPLAGGAGCHQWPHANQLQAWSWKWSDRQLLTSYLRCRLCLGLLRLCVDRSLWCVERDWEFPFV
jgi:hypothetical protein